MGAVSQRLWLSCGRRGTEGTAVFLVGQSKEGSSPGGPRGLELGSREPESTLRFGGPVQRRWQRVVDACGPLGGSSRHLWWDRALQRSRPPARGHRPGGHVPNWAPASKAFPEPCARGAGASGGQGASGAGHQQCVTFARTLGTGGQDHMAAGRRPLETETSVPRRPVISVWDRPGSHPCIRAGRSPASATR